MSDDPTEEDFDEQSEVELIERMNRTLDNLKRDLQRVLDEAKNSEDVNSG